MSGLEEEVASEPEERRSERGVAEEMRLRPSPARVTRLSRRALAALGGVSAVVVAGALLWGLHTRKSSGPASQELYNTDNKPPADQMAGLPRDYAGLARSEGQAEGAEPVPQLGPRLPGDLGRPILNAGAPAPAIGTSGQEGSTPGATSTTMVQTPVEQRREQARQQLAQEKEAARTSQLFSSRASGAAQPVTTVPAAAVGLAATSAASALAQPPRVIASWPS